MDELRQLIENAEEQGYLLFYKIRNGKLIEYKLSENAPQELIEKFKKVMISKEDERDLYQLDLDFRISLLEMGVSINDL